MCSLSLKVLEAYLKYMTDIGVLVGGEKSKTREQMEKVIAFERIIANVSKLLCELAIKFSHIVPDAQPEIAPN